MKYLIPLLVILLVVAFLWDRHFTELRLEKCAKANAQVVMVYGKARSCPEGAQP
ncbi:hypothetical protein J658_0055 [Acinetobacter baumannii 573719]|nr:hypothetical protein J658_0055 [Acinetobacter baumannii 573719]